MAYHLHRLNLTGSPLREALRGKAYLATALSQGRTTIDAGFITTLAATLYVADDELCRHLMDDEIQEWSFYRSSAKARSEIWEAVENHINANNLTHSLAADTLYMDRRKLIDNLSGRRRMVLERKQIANLLQATNTRLEPEHWLTIIQNEGGAPQISTPEL